MLFHEPLDLAQFRGPQAVVRCQRDGTEPELRFDIIMRHMDVRQEKGLRPGGLGLFMTKQIVDELLYNEKQNEVVFVKYLR